MASSQLHRNPAAGSSGNTVSGRAAEECKKIRETLVYPEGEIPLLDKDDDSWTLIRSGPLATKSASSDHWWKPFSSGTSWTDASGALFDNYFLLFKEETDSLGTTRRRLVQRPIPLECLRLGPFNNGPEIRKHDRPWSKRIVPWTSPPPADSVHPFTIYHAAARMTRRYTLYTHSATERNRWHNAFKDAAETRKAEQQANMSFTPQTLDSDFFRVPPRIQLTHGKHFTGEVLCASEFSYRGRQYLAVGCATGVYIRDRASNSSFQGVLVSDKPTSIAAIPVFNKFLVHCESALFSYPLDLVIRVSRGDATSKDLTDLEEKLAQEGGNVLFFKAGQVANRNFVIYSAKKSKQATIHILELTRQGSDPQIPANFDPLRPPMSIPEDPLDATFFHDRVAIHSSKAIYLAELKNTTDPPLELVPEFPNSKRSANAFQRVLKGKNNKAKVLPELGNGDTQKILGTVRSGNNILVVYDNLGYFIDERGISANSTYYTPWECKATAFAQRGSSLLLFSPGFIEVRSLDTGKLIQVIEMGDVRPLRCGWMEQDMLVAAIQSGSEGDGTRKQRLVELK